MDKKIELSHGLLQSNKNVILRLCDNSDGSQDVIESDDEVKYQLANGSDVIQYHVVKRAQPNHSAEDMKPVFIDQKLIQGQQECQFYFINDMAEIQKQAVAAATTTIVPQNQPCLISPKVSGLPGGDTAMNQALKRSYLLEPAKKRDDKRRATHNEVERRRRDKINSWIFKLKELMPETDSAEASPQPEPRTKTSMGDSKSQILIKACDYIKNMQEELISLRKCLTESEQRNEQLQQENDELKDKLHFSQENGGN